MRENPSVAERARWLAEVAEALEHARKVVDRINEEGDVAHFARTGAWAAAPRHTAELSERIRAAQQRTRALRLGSDRRLAQRFRP